VVEEIRGLKSSDREKRDMLRTIKKFEDEQAKLQERNSLSDESNEDTDDEISLAERVAGLSVETSDFEELWGKLTSKEKKHFEAMMADDMNQLESMVELETPWWIGGDARRLDLHPGIHEVHAQPVCTVEESFRHPHDNTPTKKAPIPNYISDGKAARPEVSTRPPHPNILFNLLNVLYAYVLGWRHFNGEMLEESVEACYAMCFISAVLGHDDAFAFKTSEEALVAAATQSQDYFLASTKSAAGLAGTNMSERFGLTDKSIRVLFGDVKEILSSYHYMSAAIWDLLRVFKSAEMQLKAAPKASDHTLSKRRLFLTIKKIDFLDRVVNTLQHRVDNRCAESAIHVHHHHDGVLDILQNDIESAQKEHDQEAQAYEQQKGQVQAFLDLQKRNRTMIQEI
jgi:hypothetical protein